MEYSHVKALSALDEVTVVVESGGVTTAVVSINMRSFEEYLPCVVVEVV